MTKTAPDVEKARTRLGTFTYFNAYRKLQHSLRCLVAGDVSLILGDQHQQRANDGVSPKLPDRLHGDLYDIMVSQVEQGRSNELIKAVKTLIMQTSFTLPDIEIEDGERIESMAVQAYLAKRLGPKPVGCDANQHMKKVLADYLISGMSWSHVVLNARGIPEIKYLDLLDVTYDMSAEMPQDINWYSYTCRKPLGDWIQMFGEEHFKTYASQEDYSSLDRPFALEFYYDTDGESGAHHVLLGDSTSGSYEPIYSGPNPFYTVVDQERRPLLNAVPSMFLMLPSVRFPMGIVQQMLPHQISLWLMERYEKDVIERGKPGYIAQKGGVDAKSIKAFLDGKTGGLIEVENPNTFQRLEALEIPQTVLENRARHDKQIQEASGVNPFVNGGSGAGEFDFSSQVQAISANSDLTANHIAKDHASHWQTTTKVFIAIGHIFDDGAITLSVDGTDMQFGEGTSAGPIGPYLRPEMDITISEDAMRFKPRVERAAMAKDKLLTVMQFPQFPKAIDMAMEDYLRATGVKNVSAALEPPAPAPGAPGGAGMPQQSGMASADAAVSSQ